MALDSVDQKEQPKAGAPAAAVAAAQDGAAAAPPKPGKAKRIFGIVGVLALVGIGYWGYGWWTEGRFLIETDDAYVHADIAAISPKIQGYVDDIPVVENQLVAAGDIIATLDDGDDRIALATAENRVVIQRASLNRIEAQTSAAKVAVLQAQAQKQAADALLHNAEITANRQTTLVANKSAPQSALDDATSVLEQARAGVKGAEAQIAAAEANVSVLQAEYDEAASQIETLTLAVEQAKRTLALTVLRAPYAGIVANIAIERGDLVSPGQRLAAIVPTDKLYIEANYKETQQQGMTPGAVAHIRVDAIPGKVFEGKVESVSPATGAMFSVLPTSNATGNFTKIVQRVPVRIAIPADLLATGQLRAGLSVVVEVDSRTGQGTTGLNTAGQTATGQ